MADEFDELELEEEVESQAPAPVQDRPQDKRLKDLSEKVKLTAEERDEKENLLQAATKDVEFYKNFNSLVAKFPGASEYQDKIREKVLSGYDPEEAVVAILHKEGKLPGMQQTPIAPTSNASEIAGGSSPTTIATESGEKPVGEMTQAERRAELSKLTGSEMSQAFRGASQI